jgi:hypothetical protein
MPQLDIVSFCSQFFWLCFFYGGFYMLCVKFFLPRLSRVLFVRYTKTHTTLENGQNDDTSEESFFSEHALRDAETRELSHLVKGVHVTRSLCHSTITGSLAKVRSATTHVSKDKQFNDAFWFKGPFAQPHVNAYKVLIAVTADTLLSTEAVSQSEPPMHSSLKMTTRAVMRCLVNNKHGVKPAISKKASKKNASKRAKALKPDTPERSKTLYWKKWHIEGCMN